VLTVLMMAFMPLLLLHRATTMPNVSRLVLSPAARRASCLRISSITSAGTRP
jgi:hypothetical protein